MRIMKNIGLISILLLVFTSCEKWIDPEININPDAPLQTTPDVLLPGVQASLAYYLGGFDVAGTAGIWMQQIQGVRFQAGAIQGYNYRASDPNNLWNSMYTGPMMDLKQMIAVCDAPETRSPVLGGISKVMMAIALGNMTDLWGDIPNTEAFQGNALSPVLKPKMDSQELVYDDIFRLLDEAISDLKNDSVPRYEVSADYFYMGDEIRWLKAAYHLRGRYRMHLLKIRPPDNYDVIIADLENQGFAGVGDDMEVFFDISSSGWNPLYQFITLRPGYAADNPFYASHFSHRNYGNSRDPRYGLNIWDGDEGYWTLRYAPVTFAQYAEAQFLIAEAYFMQGEEDGARYYLDIAINASLDKYGIDKNDFGNANWLTGIKAAIDATSGPALLEFIMVEKYKHMFCQLESWTDWRRTGYPVLTPTVGTQVPRRYPYPQSERDYNDENTDVVQIFNRVWWDSVL